MYLELRYFLSECREDSVYYATECDIQGCRYLSTNSGHVINRVEGFQTEPHGPAMCTRFDGIVLPVDGVYSVRCLSWPPQADDWPKRLRHHDWPDSLTVDHIVSNGCDVVGVTHRHCRQNQWMDQHQWRLSFSRAEIVLINSWMPVQQIMYHLLRVYVKTERLTGGSDNSGTAPLSNYHIKTLMLWSCEMKPRSWWAENVSVVRLCAELLHSLSRFLSHAHCPHYFINNCNLLDTSLNVENVASQLMLIDEAYLSTWLVNKYIRRCAQICPGYISRLFDNVSTVTELQSAVSAIVNWTVSQNTSRYQLLRTVDFTECYTAASVSNACLTVRSCVCWMNELAKIDTRLSQYFTAVALLHVARRIIRNGLSEKLMDILATILGPYIDSRRYSNQYSLSLLSKAVKVMTFAAKKSPSNVQLIETELSKAYLLSALSCKDSESDSIYCLASVYLSVLYYTTGQYQTAIDHCTLVTRSRDHKHCSLHVVQGEVLPNIDCDIDNILGLSYLYDFVRSDILDSKQSGQNASVFTTELFGYYLRIRNLSVKKCRQVTQTSLTDVAQQYAKCTSEMQRLFIGDVLIFKLLNRALEQQTVCNKPQRNEWGRSAVSEFETNSLELTNLLQESAVEHLKAYRQLQAGYFGSVVTIVTTNSEALYAYKRVDYQHCLQLCSENILKTLYDMDTT